MLFAVNTDEWDWRDEVGELSQNSVDTLGSIRSTDSPRKEMRKLRSHTADNEVAKENERNARASWERPPPSGPFDLQVETAVAIGGAKAGSKENKDRIKKQLKDTTSRLERSLAQAERNQHKRQRVAFSPRTPKEQRTVIMAPLRAAHNQKCLLWYFEQKKIDVESIVLFDATNGTKAANVELSRELDIARVCGLEYDAESFRFTPPILSEQLGGKLLPIRASSGKIIQSRRLLVTCDGVTIPTKCVRSVFKHLGTLLPAHAHLPSATATPKNQISLQYYHPSEASLAMKTMHGKTLAGKKLEVDWDSKQVEQAGTKLVATGATPFDANERVQTALIELNSLAQLDGTPSVQKNSSKAGTFAQRGQTYPFRQASTLVSRAVALTPMATPTPTQARAPSMCSTLGKPLQQQHTPVNVPQTPLVLPIANKLASKHHPSLKSGKRGHSINKSDPSLESFHRVRAAPIKSHLEAKLADADDYTLL